MSYVPDLYFMHRMIMLYKCAVGKSPIMNDIKAAVDRGILALQLIQVESGVPGDRLMDPTKGEGVRSTCYPRGGERSSHEFQRVHLGRRDFGPWIKPI